MSYFIGGVNKLKYSSETSLSAHAPNPDSQNDSKCYFSTKSDSVHFFDSSDSAAIPHTGSHCRMAATQIACFYQDLQFGFRPSSGR